LSSIEFLLSKAEYFHTVVSLRDISGQKLNILNLGLGLKASQGWEAFIFVKDTISFEELRF